MSGLSSIAIAGIVACASVPAFADNNPRYDYATVIEATPITQWVQVSQPQQRCWNEQVTHRHEGRASPGATIVGGLIGAAIGHQLGSGRGGRAFGTVAGAVVGGAIASEASRGPDRYRDEVQTRCENVGRTSEEERLIGYRVIYRYNGQTYETRLADDPGDSLRVRVSVEPMP